MTYADFVRTRRFLADMRPFFEENFGWSDVAEPMAGFVYPPTMLFAIIELKKPDGRAVFDCLEAGEFDSLDEAEKALFKWARDNGVGEPPVN